MSKPELALFAKSDGTGRAYRHPFRLGSDGKLLTAPSVTTILGLVDKPALMQWAADQTLEWAVQNVASLYTKSEEAAVQSARFRWKQVRDERAEVGTGIHETIESLHTGRWEYPALDEEQDRIMEQWGLLNQRYTITPHRSEFSVFSHMDNDSMAWAGTADGLWDILDNETGTLYENLVIDIKTSKNMWPEHWLQLAALKNAEVIMVKNEDGTWREEQMPDGDGTAIIHLREDKFAVHVEQDKELIGMQYDQFMGYRNLWDKKKKVESFVSARDRNLAMSFTTTNNK